MSAKTIRIITGVLFGTIFIAKVFSGGTGEEALGSEEKPVIWAMVFEHPDAPAIDDIERFFVPLELEIGHYMDAVVLDSYEDVFAILLAGGAHCVILPPLTYLIALRDNIVEPGIIGYADSGRTGGLIVGQSKLVPETIDDILKARIARSDTLSQDGWLTTRLAIEATTSGISDDISYVEADTYAHVIELLLDDEADFGILPAEYRGEIGVGLSIFVEFESIAGWGIHFHPSATQEFRSRITQSLQARTDEPESLGFLNDLYGWNRIETGDENLTPALQAILSSVGLDIDDLP